MKFNDHQFWSSVKLTGDQAGTMIARIDNLDPSDLIDGCCTSRKGGGIMSMTLAQAYEAALRSIGDGMRITSAAEGTGHWFFGVGDAFVDAVPGGSPIAIDKQNGEPDYSMPPVPSDLLGMEPLPIEVEVENAVDVPLPA